MTDHDTTGPAPYRCPQCGPTGETAEEHSISSHGAPADDYEAGATMVSAIVPASGPSGIPSGPPVESLPVRDFESAEFPVKVAKTLRVERYGAQPARLFIDGEPFPYATKGGYAAGPTTKYELPSVTFALVGYNVEYVDTLEKRPAAPALDLVDECGPDCPKCARLLAEARQERERREQGDLPDAVKDRLIARGRREAAEAIRQQARMFEAGGKVEGTEGTMLSFVVAAQLAEGTTGVTGGGS